MLAHRDGLTLCNSAALINTSILIDDGDIVANRVLRLFAPLEANHLDSISARGRLEPIDVFLRA